jgi:hypothetical protein
MELREERKPSFCVTCQPLPSARCAKRCLRGAPVDSKDGPVDRADFLVRVSDHLWAMTCASSHRALGFHYSPETRAGVESIKHSPLKSVGSSSTENRGHRRILMRARKAFP